AVSAVCEGGFVHSRIRAVARSSRKQLPSTRREVALAHAADANQNHFEPPVGSCNRESHLVAGTAVRFATVIAVGVARSGLSATHGHGARSSHGTRRLAAAS